MCKHANNTMNVSMVCFFFQKMEASRDTGNGISEEWEQFLQGIRDKGRICDAELTSKDGGTFSVNRMVLCSASKYFRSVWQLISLIEDRKQ
jgi:hypothetical protein